MDISSADLNKAIGEILEQYGADVTQIVDEEIDTIAKRAVKDLKKGEGGFKGNKYPKGWKSKKESLFGGLYSKVIIHNAKLPGLTHLLEKGHDIYSHGVNTGKRTREFHHISVVNDRVARELPNALLKRINKL